MQLDVFTVDVSEKTTWILFRLADQNGRIGVGEATLNGRTDQVLEAVPDAIRIVGRSGISCTHRLADVRRSMSDVVGRAIASGLEQAWLDVEGQATGRPIHALLGGAHRLDIPVYANINRGTTTRQPAEFAERAALAIADGYRAVKLAPFDGVTPDAADEAERDRLIDAGMKRIAVVKERIGDTGRVQVDCHSRFRRNEVHGILETLAGLGIAWFEEPIAETADAVATIARLRTAAEAHAITLAGAEQCADTADFLPFVAGRCYDVVMPDIVLAGGPAEVVRIGHLATALGVQVSLHNPCGPVMDMQSVHAAAAIPALHSLERQFRESPLYDELMKYRAHTFADGAIGVGEAPGLGVEIDWAHAALVSRASYSLDI